ncbi:MAG: hypothetical protein IJ747_00430 [Lachnospiraceae bacterium]|nr:hypothetical protein [Lachnospiraceae bacterium]
MCQALREIMKPELEQSRQEGLEEGIKEGICVTVRILRGLGQAEESIKESIMGNYMLSQDAAEKYMMTQ